jgi:hypothetical protein
MIFTHHRGLFAVSIATIAAGMGVELLDPGGWVGPVIGCIGFTVALFLAWDMPRAPLPPSPYARTTIQAPEEADDSR